MSSRLRTLLAAVLVLVVVAGVVAVFVFRDRLPANASELQVGDCFKVPDGDSISDVQHQPCNEPHDGEVFVVADYASDATTYPTSDQFDTWVGTECVDKAFPTYTGTTYDSREDIDLGYFYPLEENWDKGERQMICYLTPVGVDSVTSSYRQGQASPAPS
jgi:Septum formation